MKCNIYLISSEHTFFFFLILLNPGGILVLGISWKTASKIQGQIDILLLWVMDKS